MNDAIIIQEHPRQHRLVLLILTAIALASLTVVRFGDIYSIDEWVHVYYADAGRLGLAASRPVSLLWLRLTYLFTGAHPVPGFLSYNLLRIGTAYGLYLLIRELVPHRAYFAFLTGAAYLLIFVRDVTYIGHWQLTGEALSFVPVTVYALYAYFRYMRRNQLIFLFLAVVCALLAIFMRELVIPLLFFFPALAFIVHREYSRARWIGLAVWYLVCGLSTLNYALPILGLTSDSYGSSLLQTDYLSVSHITHWSWVQFWQVFSHIIFLKPTTAFVPEIYPQVLLAVAVTVLGSLALLPRLHLLSAAETDQTYSFAETWQAAFWILIGAVATWLSLLPFLVTWYGQFLLRVHVLAMVGESVLVAAAIWLVSSLFRHEVVYRSVSVVLLAMLCWFSSLNVAQLQSTSNTWDQQAYFYRELAHLVPAAQENTLLFYDFNFENVQPPLFGGWTFQFSVSYLYGDSVFAASDGNMRGVVPQITDHGIDIVLSKDALTGDLARESSHHWDEIIFVSIDDYGHAYIIEELPPDYFTLERQTQYDPYSRIVTDAFIPPRIMQLLPPLHNPQRPDQ